MKVEERITRIEKIIAEEDRFRWLERKSIGIAKTLLLIVALAAPIIWSLFELASFLVNRFLDFKHSLGY